MIYRLIKYMLLALAACFLIVNLTGCSSSLIGILNPKGYVTFEERRLFFNTMALMLIVVLPVIIMSFTFVYHYQVSHRVRDYKPNWSHSYFLESLWWGIPCVIIVVLAIITFKKTRELDPYHQIAGYSEKPLQIQVIALPWKWLFIYPEQNIATVNYLVIKNGQPVEFFLTCDNVPMSAFFIPQLGSQIYTMAGMQTRLNLIANYYGKVDGMNTQFNGPGFSDMHFPVYVVDTPTLNGWIADVKKSTQKLDDMAYSQLLNPSVNDPAKFYAGVKPGLFNSVIALYMNSSGREHPRNNQLKYQYKLD